MIRIEYRSQSDGNPIKVILTDMIVHVGRNFTAYFKGKAVFRGITANIISEEDVDEDSHLVDRAEGQGD